MPSKYSIYGGGRWREIDLETGRVAGWAGSNFAYTKRGKLVVLRRKSVLRGLKDLEGGHISSVKQGPHLTQLIKKKMKCLKSPNPKCKCCHQHICTAPDVKMIKPNLLNASIQCNIVSSKKQKNRNSTEIDLASVSSKVSDNIARAITISESDVETFRSYILNDKRNIFNVDVFMYDANDDYKRSIFYKITPIVKVQRHPVISMLLKRNQVKVKLNSAEMRSTYLKPLSENVHCEPKIKIIEYNKDSSDEKTASNVLKPERVRERKENRVLNRDQIVGERGKRKVDMVVSNEPKKVRPNNSDILKENKVQSVRNGRTDNKVFLVKKWKVKSKRSRPANVFSLLEDEAIVSWIIENKKANAVNGNKIWKEMEPMHIKLTGRYRSWHSLRNRYLRHLLAALGGLSLSAAQAAELRAAAAAGHLKARRNRRNSIYFAAPVRSAWSARPRRPQLSDDETSTSPRLLRSSAVPVSRSKLPTYSEITRRFAENHRSTPNSEHGGNEKTNKENESEDKTAEKPRRVGLKIIGVDANANSEGRSLRVLNTDGGDDRQTEETPVGERARHKRDREDNANNLRRVEISGVNRQRSTIYPESRQRAATSRRFCNEVVSDDDEKSIRQRTSKGESQKEKNNNENRSSDRRPRDAYISSRDKNLGQQIDTDHEDERQSTKTRHESGSSRWRSLERSLVEQKNRQNSKAESDTEERHEKRERTAKKRLRSPEPSNGAPRIQHDDERHNTKDARKNTRSSRRNRTPEGSLTDKVAEKKKKDENDRSRRRKDEEISDMEKAKTKKDVNGRSSRRVRDEEGSGDERNLRGHRDKDESEKKAENGRSSRILVEERSEVVKKTHTKGSPQDASDTEHEDTKKTRRNTRASRRRRSPVESETDETKRQESKKRPSKKFRSPETSRTEEKHRRSRGSLEQNVDRGEKDKSSRRNKKRVETEDREDSAENKMYLRQYRYKSNGVLENSRNRMNRASGDSQHREQPKTDTSKILKPGSKRKRAEMSSDTENEGGNSKDEREESRNAIESEGDFSVSDTSRSGADGERDGRRVTRQSRRSEIRSRDSIVFEISDNDEADEASRSDKERGAKKRTLRKLFNHRAL